MRLKVIVACLVALPFVCILVLPAVNVKDTIPYDVALRKAPGKTAPILGHKVHYVDQGKGAAIVMIHGFLYSTVMWEKQIAHFSKKYRVVALDLWGMGYSERLPLEKYSFDLFADEVVGLLDHLGIESAILMGQSMGGATSVKVAAKYPSRVKALVLSSPAILPYESGATSKIYELPLIGEFLNAIPGNGLMINNLKNVFFYDEAKITDDYLEKVFYPLQIERSYDTLMHILRNVLGPPLMQPEAEALAKKPLPTLIVHGKQDPAIPYQKSEAFKAMLKKAAKLVVFDKARHTPHEEYPGRFNKLVDKFLAELRL